MNSIIKTYAPVIIPTLNRYDHFRQCLESLEKCTGADKTEVFIGLDYPPSEKYVEGWKKINEYLKGKEEKNAFQNLIVERRTYNCGIGHENSNFNLLRKKISERYDRFIVSEDDNIFSSNFLEYINDGLEKYKDNPDCMTICGYNLQGVTLEKYDNNCYFSHEFSAWGTGYWRDKRTIISSIINKDFAMSIMSNWHNIWTIYKNEPRLLNTIIMNLDCGKIFGDTMIVSYQYLNNKYSLFPKVSKVRNIGCDGSGTSIFKVNDSFIKQVIDENEYFECDQINESSLEVAMPEVRQHMKRSAFMNFIVFVRCFVYWLTKKDILYYEVKRRNKPLFVS